MTFLRGLRKQQARAVGLSWCPPAVFSRHVGYHQNHKRQHEGPEVKGRMVRLRLGIRLHRFITVSVKTHCDDLRT